MLRRAGKKRQGFAALHRYFREPAGDQTRHPGGDALLST
jgi:hypothetical protein